MPRGHNDDRKQQLPMTSPKASTGCRPSAVARSEGKAVAQASQQGLHGAAQAEHEKADVVLGSERRSCGGTGLVRSSPEKALKCPARSGDRVEAQALEASRAASCSWLRQSRSPLSRKEIKEL